MDILIINPNSTASMTDGIAAAARDVALPDTTITAVNPADGPAAIQGAADGEAALPGLFATFETAMADDNAYDAVVIACFDDTGLAALKKRSNVPVLGIGEAGYLAALMRGETFSVVTTLAISVPVLEDNITRYGFSGRCKRVRASGARVLDLDNERTRDTAETTVERQVAAAITEDGCDSIVLGCAGMAGFARRMTRDFQRPVIDGVAAAIGFCEALQRTGKAA